jgi:hypothetical protein
MTELVVMEKDAGRMNVPLAKVQEYLDAGWVEIERVPMTGDVSSIPAEAAPKSKGKGKAVLTEAEE